MKGSFFKSVPKDRQHLADDYRDPEPPPLPPAVPHELQRDECSSIRSMSLKNALSDPWLMDQLKEIGYRNKPKKIFDIEYIKSCKEAILKREAENRDRKNRRLKQKDIDQAMARLEAEGLTLTHAIMLMFLERDAAMLQALKSVEPAHLTSRPTLKTHRDGRFIMSSLKHWEKLLKEREKGKAASTLLYVTLYLEKRSNPTYYWLVYELYHLAVRTAKGCRGKLTEAVIRYLFGKFLIGKAKHYKEAEFHLERACKLSYGYNWTAAFLAPELDEHIHDNSNYLLHILLIKRANDTSYSHPIEAVNLAKKAVRVIKRANNGGALADAHYDLAVMYNRAHMPERAIFEIAKALALHTKLKDEESICLSLLFAAHCFRRLKEYEKAADVLKSVVSRAQQSDLPSLEAKAYKHLAEYFLGKNMMQSASNYLKKSYELFEKCDLRDELDEVATIFNYTKAWLRVHDLYHLIVAAMSKEPTDVFDYVDFIEFGVPAFNRYHSLKFVYKAKDNDNTRPTDQKENKKRQDSMMSSGEGREKSPDQLEDELRSDSGRVSESPESIRSEPSWRKVPEYFAFSDFTGLIFDEELDQALMLFENTSIDTGSDMVVKALKKVPFEQRQSKKSMTNLMALEVAGALKLNLLKHRLYKQAILTDRNEYERKMKLVIQQQPQDEDEDYDEKQNEKELCKFSVEIQPVVPLEVYSQWQSKAHLAAQKYKYTPDINPKTYGDLLSKLLLLIRIYTRYDKALAIQESSPIPTGQESDNYEQPEVLEQKSVLANDSSGSKHQPVKTDMEGQSDQSKIPKVCCRCKDPAPRTKDKTRASSK